MINFEKYNFAGRYSEHFVNFIAYKRSLGYKYYRRQIREMARLNRFLSDYPEITKDVSNSWTNTNHDENHRTQKQRITQIRQFKIYLNSIGVKSYISPTVREKPSSFVPYIFTPKEIAAIIHESDNLKYNYRSPFHHIAYPLLARLLYCSGLRISEALSIEVSDIDFNERLIRIKQAKYNNSRLIPLHDQLWHLLLKYLEDTGRETGLLFRGRRDNPYHLYTAQERFKKLMKAAGIALLENGKLPRLHDIRHTFAVHSLEKMIDRGEDVYVVLPYLSDYMGHRSIKATEKYLRLTSENFNRIIAPTEELYKNLYPKGEQH
jgi:integrase